VLRAGLKALLSGRADMQVVGEAGDGQEALKQVLLLQPDLVLLDLSLPGIGGIEITRQIKEQRPATVVLILTVFEDASLLREALQAGASGYILKRAAGEELISAIQAVMRGDLYVHASLTRALLDGLAPASQARPAGEETLTRREIDVLRLIVQGYTNRQIADALTISIRTVESHRANLMSKLDLHSRVELVRYAAQVGLLEPGTKN
jgi:DNA-binding NarL/FixJ family response regulator